MSKPIVQRGWDNSLGPTDRTSKTSMTTSWGTSNSSPKRNAETVRSEEAICDSADRWVWHHEGLGFWAIYGACMVREARKTELKNSVDQP
jgi:hypothetical protein